MPKLLIFLLSLTLYLYPVTVGAQAQKNVQKTFRTDSSKITPAKFNKEAISNYKEQKEFQYDEIPIDQLSLWDRFWMWFWSIINKMFTSAASNPISRYFFIALGAALIVYIIIRLVGSENLFSKPSKAAILPYDVMTENIHEIDYDKELQRLITEGKYRLAVRLLYLQALKKLNDTGMIEWQPDKTNYNYLTEISKAEIKSDFGQLTLQFDYIWYGDFPVDESKFKPIALSFDHFKTRLNEGL